VGVISARLAAYATGARDRSGPMLPSAHKVRQQVLAPPEAEPLPPLLAETHDSSIVDGGEKFVYEIISSRKLLSMK
jgi:hypothetical protein